MKTQRKSRFGFEKPGCRIWNFMFISIVSIVLGALTVGCGSQRYYMPGGRYNSGGCDCPAFTLGDAPVQTKADGAASDGACASASSITPTSVGA